MSKSLNIPKTILFSNKNSPLTYINYNNIFDGLIYDAVILKYHISFNDYSDNIQRMKSNLSIQIITDRIKITQINTFNHYTFSINTKKQLLHSIKQ